MGKVSLMKKLNLLTKKFSITVVVYHVYQNIVFPRIYKGIYLKDKIKVAEGSIDAYHFYFKKGFFNYEEIPQISLNNIINLGNSRMVQVVQLAEDLFLPLIPVDGRLVYYMKTPVLDEMGQVKKMENGEDEVEITEYLFNTCAELRTRNGVIKIPSMMPQENYANRAFFQSESLRMSSKYAARDFWSKNAGLIMLVVAFIGIAIVLKMNYDGYVAAAQQLTSATQAVATAVEAMAKMNASIGGA